MECGSSLGKIDATRGYSPKELPLIAYKLFGWSGHQVAPGPRRRGESFEASWSGVVGEPLEVSNAPPLLVREAAGGAGYFHFVMTQNRTGTKETFAAAVHREQEQVHPAHGLVQHTARIATAVTARHIGMDVRHEAIEGFASITVPKLGVIRPLNRAIEDLGIPAVVSSERCAADSHRTGSLHQPINKPQVLGSEALLSQFFFRQAF